MSTANKWLLGFVIFCTLGLFVVSMMVNNMGSKWKAHIADLEKKLVQADERHETLLRGTPPAGGVVQLRHDVNMYLAARGRAWYNAMPQQVDAETGEMRVGELPTPNGIQEDLLVYIFQQKVVAEDGSEKAGAYLGHFRADGFADGQVVFVPVVKMLPRQLEQLSQSTGPWAIYDVMPSDRYDIFDDMSDEQLRAMLPAESVDDYIAHGQPHNPDEHPADRIDDDGNYRRALRDYAVLFAEMHRLHVVQTDIVATVRDDLASVQAAIAQSRVQEEFMDKTIVSVTAELTETRRQLAAVMAHQTDVEERLDAVEAKIEQTSAENQMLAGKWIESQLEDLAHIEQAAQTAATTPEPAAAP